MYVDFLAVAALLIWDIAQRSTVSKSWNVNCSSCASLSITYAVVKLLSDTHIVKVLYEELQENRWRGASHIEKNKEKADD